VQAGNGAREVVARASPEILSEQYRQGLTPDGSPNKLNEEDTREQKIRQLGHATSLRGRQEVLSDPGLYVLLESPNGGWVILPPTEREDAIRGLRDKGYRVHEMPEAARDLLEEELTRRLAQL